VSHDLILLKFSLQRIIEKQGQLEMEVGKIFPMQAEFRQEMALSRVSANVRLQNAQALAIRYLAIHNLNKAFDIFFSNVAVKKVLGSYFGARLGASAKQDGFTRAQINRVHRGVFTPKTLGRLYFCDTEK
jgi:hypothetical protein